MAAATEEKTTELKTLTIQVEKRFKKMPGSSQLKSIADQLATMLYGKGLTDCIGKSQSVRVSGLKDKNGRIKRLILQIPREAWEGSEGGHIKQHRDSWGTYKQNYQSSITKMVNHARCVKIPVQINFIGPSAQKPRGKSKKK